MEGICEAAVKTFNEAICLGMIGSGRLMMDVEEGTEVGPKGGSM
jgi:hypothetical protein